MLTTDSPDWKQQHVYHIVLVDVGCIICRPEYTYCIYNVYLPVDCVVWAVEMLQINQRVRFEVLSLQG